MAKHALYPTREMVEALREMGARSALDRLESDVSSSSERQEYNRFSYGSGFAIAFEAAVRSSDIAVASLALKAIDELFRGSINSRETPTSPRGARTGTPFLYRYDRFLYDTLSDEPIDFLISVKYREHYHNYNGIFEESSGRYLNGLIRNGLITNELVERLLAIFERDGAGSSGNFVDLSDYLIPERRAELPEL